MKAIKVLEPFKLEIVEIDKPVIEKADDVIIKVTAGGICGSDMQIYNGTNSLVTYPRLIGHEFGGVVTEVGSGVTDIKVGDHVCVDPVISCGECGPCKIGRSNVCEKLEAMGVHREGGFSEFVKAPEANVYKFQGDFPTDLLSLPEPFSIGMEINERGRIAAGEKVFIMGCGPIGLCALQIAKMKGAEVIISDLVESKLEIAKSMGADDTILIGKEDVEEKLNAFKGGDIIAAIIDTVCIPSSFEQCVQISCPASRIVVLGLKNVPSSIPMSEITKKELDIVGSRLSNRCFGKVVEAFESGKLAPEGIKTHEFSFMDAQKAIDFIIASPQEVLKVVLKFEE